MGVARYDILQNQLSSKQVGLIQRAGNSNGATSAGLSASFSSNVTRGDLLVIVGTGITGVAGTPTMTVASDSQGLTWLTAKQEKVSGGAFGCISTVFYAVATATGGETITIATGGVQYSLAMEIYELVGSIAPKGTGGSNALTCSTSPGMFSSSGNATFDLTGFAYSPAGNDLGFVVVSGTIDRTVGSNQFVGCGRGVTSIEAGSCSGAPAFGGGVYAEAWF